MIFPSILATNFAHLKGTLQDLEKLGVKNIHFDVMDNHFVPNLTFGYQFIQNLRPETSLGFDVHLMIENPLENISLYIEAGANFISCHFEAFKENAQISQAIKLCKQKKVHFGLALKPHTPVSVLENFLPHLHFVLIMSVEPGFGGQSFILETLNKLDTLNSLRKNGQYFPKIQVDGGVNKTNIQALKEHSVDYLVVGSAFFNENISQNPLLEFNTK